MQVFTESFDVVLDDLDELDHVNNIRYVQWIQEISKKHWEKVVGRERGKKFIWVVRNHNITYHRSAVLGDRIQLTTNVEQFRGAISDRVVEIKNAGTGELLVSARTQWCLLEAKRLRPIRIPEMIANLFNPD